LSSWEVIRIRYILKNKNKNMNTIDTSHENDASNLAQPFKITSLQFMLDSQKETFSNTIISLIGASYNSTQVYILWGCVRGGAADGTTGTAAWISLTGADPGSTVAQAGAIFYGGEIYTVMNYRIASMAGYDMSSIALVTNGTPDPTTFSDNITTFNVHNVRQWIMSVGALTFNLVNGWLPAIGSGWNEMALTDANLTAGAGGTVTLITGAVYWIQIGKTMTVNYRIVAATLTGCSELYLILTDICTRAKSLDPGRLGFVGAGATGTWQTTNVFLFGTTAPYLNIQEFGGLNFADGIWTFQGTATFQVD
jgi:hypothetical protein